MADPTPTPSDAPVHTGGMGAPIDPTRSARRQHRLRTRIAVSLLGGDAKGTVAEAVAYLREVVAGKHPLAERTRTAAATALLRAGIDVSEPERVAPTPTIDARSVTLNLTTGTRPTAEDVREALRMLDGARPPGAP